MIVPFRSFQKSLLEESTSQQTTNWPLADTNHHEKNTQLDFRLVTFEPFLFQDMSQLQKQLFPAIC